MDELWKFLSRFVEVFLVSRVDAPALSYQRGLAFAAAGGLVGGFLVVGMMGWLSPDFTKLERPLDAAARSMFGGLFFGMLGGVAMSGASACLHHHESFSRRVLLSAAMLIVGGSLLLLAHLAGAEISSERHSNREWWAMAAHGALAATAAVNLVDFHAIPNGMRCGVVSILASMIGGLGYGAVIWAGLRNEIQFIWGRGLFVTVATIPYLACILASLFLARMGENRILSVFAGK